MQAIAELGDALDPARITHLVVASCTGFVAPGIDQIIARRLGLSRDGRARADRLHGLLRRGHRAAHRAAYRAVRARSAWCWWSASSCRRCTSASPTSPSRCSRCSSSATAPRRRSSRRAAHGLELGEGRSLALDDSDDLIRWDIGDKGFEMHLSGEVPGRIARGARRSGRRSDSCSATAAAAAARGPRRRALDPRCGRARAATSRAEALADSARGAGATSATCRRRRSCSCSPTDGARRDGRGDRDRLRPRPRRRRIRFAAS